MYGAIGHNATARSNHRIYIYIYIYRHPIRKPWPAAELRGEGLRMAGPCKGTARMMITRTKQMTAPANYQKAKGGHYVLFF